MRAAAGFIFITCVTDGGLEWKRYLANAPEYSTLASKE
jgi:hypothetical protein